MEVSQPGKRDGPFWRDLATSQFFHIKLFFDHMSKRVIPVSGISVDSCRDLGNRARQSGAEHPSHMNSPSR